MRSMAEIVQQLPTSPDTGLTATGILQSRQRFGSNWLTPLPREPAWKKFLEKFDEAIIKILLAAALLSMVVELCKLPDGPLIGGVAIGMVALTVAIAFLARQSQWIPSLLLGLAVVTFLIGLGFGHTLVEGLAVMIAVILATGVAFLSEYKSDREFEVLSAHKESLHVKARREGTVNSIRLEDIVVGDAVLLEAGDEIPADGRVVQATELSIDQSLMTGESSPVAKQPGLASDTAEGMDQLACLYRGTQVVDGVGLMLVTEVGDATALGQIARRLCTEDQDSATPDDEEKRIKRKLTISKELTPLQHKLKKLATIISRVGYTAAVLIFLAQLVRGVLTGDVHWPASLPDAIGVFRTLLDYFVLMVIIIVVAVPEGLPMSVTVSLALAMRKMTRANSLVRQLVACETVGSATVICTDKTGTLTQNKMRVVLLSFENEVFNRDGEWVRLQEHTMEGAMLSRPSSGSSQCEGQAGPRKPATLPGDGKPLDWLALNAAVNSTANLDEKETGRVTIGNTTEGALLGWLAENGADYAKLRLQFPPLYQIHFSSERKRMTTVTRYGDRLVALVKGAPEWVLENSLQYQAADGTVKEWTQAARGVVQDKLRDTSARAMRSLGFGYALLPLDAPATADELHARRDALESGMVYTGFVGMRDLLREDAKGAIDQCRRAGIEVKMVTGDNAETARAIACDLGLLQRPDEPIDIDPATVLTSPAFNALSDEQLKARLPKLRILARARPLDKFRMVRLLQELGEVVAVTGDGTNDAPALKQADVGLAMGIAGTEVAKEASKIILLDDSFATIVKAVHWGRALYENIQRFIQFQVTINVSALMIVLLGPLLFDVKPPFTVLQLLWINVIMDTFASIALCSEPPRPGLMDVPPKRRDESILTKSMLWTIFVTAAFFVVAMLGLLVVMKNGWLVRDEPPIDGPFTLRQNTVFFSVYVFFQVWNQINCRSLVPEVSGLAGLFSNPVFLAVAAVTAIGQVLIVTFGGTVFKVEPLGTLEWLAIIGSTASVVVFAEIARRVRLVMKGGAR
jgi:Ca2+-transporting ATPase